MIFALPVGKQQEAARLQASYFSLPCFVICWSRIKTPWMKTHFRLREIPLLMMTMLPRLPHGCVFGWDGFLLEKNVLSTKKWRLFFGSNLNQYCLLDTPYLYSRNLFDTKHVNFKRSHLWPLKNLCSNLLDKSPYKTSPNFTPRVQYVNSASNKSERSDAGSPRAKRITVLAWSVQVKQLIHRISDLLLGGSPHLVDG